MTDCEPCDKVKKKNKADIDSGKMEVVEIDMSAPQGSEAHTKAMETILSYEVQDFPTVMEGKDKCTIMKDGSVVCPSDKKGDK